MSPQQPGCPAHDAAKSGIVELVPKPRDVIEWEGHTFPLTSTTQGIMVRGSGSLKAEWKETLRTFTPPFPG